MKKKLIGNVPFTCAENSTEKKYEDSAESFLKDFFKTAPESKRTEDICELLNSNPAWDIYYNLVPQRRHVLDWYPFDKEKMLLEVGAGTGAVTGVFLDKVKFVTALELTEIRAEILSYRYSDKKNLEVVAGNIRHFKPSKKYDYVVMIGVLEYAGMFSHNNKPIFSLSHKYVLDKCNSLIKKRGKLFIAIENPLGIRYLTGAVEDHYGELFEGVENYPQYNGIRTYTKSELKKIVTESGFRNIELYTLFPDYKIPSLVMHEDYIDNFNQLAQSSFLRNIDYAHPLFSLFSEVLLSHQLEKEKLLSLFANSYLIIAEKI